MAASGGLNLQVGIELTQVEKDLQKLTSSVENVSAQLGKRLELKPTINTKAYEAAVDKMDVAFKKLQDRFSRGFDFVRKGVGENGSDIKDSFSADSLFGSIDNMKASVAQLKGMLRNPGKYELNVGDTKELVGLQELIIKNWQTSTNEIHKQDAAVKSLLEKEAKLRNETKQRINDSIGRHERDRADAKNLNRRIDQIRAERVAIGKLISDYEQLAAKQRKFGESDAGTNDRIAKLRAEHTQYKNLEREELNRQKAINQNNALFNDQGRIIGKLKTLASRYISIFTIGTLAKKVAETTGFFERQQVALEGIVGSATKAAEIMGQIKSFAPNSPFQTKQLIEYTKQLAAYNIAVDDLFPNTKMLADLSAGLGVDMQRLILAYGQVNAASVLRGQELRQFTEAGIPMVQKLADKFSELNGRIVTTGEVFELISKRQVSFDMVSQVLTDMTSAGGKFYNMQANLMGTVYGQIEKLKDLWTLSMDQIGKSSHGTITKVLSWMQAAVKNATSIFRGFVLTVTINSLGQLWSRIKQLRTEIGLLGVAANGAFGAISLGVGVAYGVFRKLWDENHKIQKQFEEIHESFQKQIDTAKEGLDEIIQKLNSTTEGTKSYQDAIDALTSNYSQYITLNDEIIQQLMQMGDAYDNIKLAIDKYNDALEKKQQLEAARNMLTEAFDASKATKSWRQYISGYTFSWDGIDNNDIQSKMEHAIQKVFNEMLSQNKLSYSENKDERYQQNRATYEDLFRKYMKAEGLEAMLGDLNMYQLFQDFSNSALFDNNSSRAYSEYRRLTRESMGEGVSDFAWLSRIENTFKDLSTTLPKQLNAQTPQGYTNEYNKEWIRAALGYMNIKNGDFDSRRDANGDRYADAEFVNMIKIMKREIANFNQASVYNVENAMNAYHAALAKVDSEGAAMLLHFLKLFQDGTEEASGRAAAVRETIFKTWEPTSAEMKFARQFLPTNQSYNTTRTRLPQEHISRIEELAQYGVSVEKTETIPTKRYKIDPNREHSTADLAEIERLKMEERVIAKLMEGVQDMAISVRDTDGNLLQAQMFDISDREKNFTRGGSKGDFTRFFADLFGMLKSAYNEQKKFIEGPQGVTNSLISSINSLSDDNILKGFYKEGVNPFQKFLDKIEDYDINTIFSADDFKSLVNTFIKDVGVDKISVADFENMWEQLLAVVRKKAVDLRAAGKDKEASKIEAYLQTMTAEGLKFFGRDEINNKIDAAIKSLTNIEEAAMTSSAQYQDMIAMMKTGNYKQIYGLFNPGKEYRDIDEANVAKQTLAQMLSPETKGGVGMASFIGKDMENILKSEQLGLSFIPELYAIISKIGKIGDELKDENGRVIDAKELQKVKDAFIKALKDLINGIKTETQKLSETRTKQETTTDKMYEAQQKYIDKINLLNKAHETGVTEIVDGKEKTVKIDDETFVDRTTEVLQEFTKNLTELLGGRYDSNIAQITGDADSKTGSSSVGNFMQMLSSMQNGGLQSAIGTGLGQSAASGGMSMGAAAGAAGAAGGIIQMIDMIVKAIYGAIKGMVDMGKATLKVMKSFDDVKEVNIDKTGIMHVKTVYGGYDFEKAEAILDTIQQTNQHAMDGWEKLKNGDPIGATAEIYSGITDLISSIRSIADMDEQRKIEALEDSATDLRNAATNLNASAERLVGFAKIQKELQAIGTNASLATDYKEMIRIEDSKKKSDGDKMREWQQQYEQAMNEFLNGVRKIRNEMVNSTEEWADAMGSAIRSAFKNGENAARGFRGTVKTMIGDVIEQMLQMAILEPLIESSIENWTNSSYLQKKFTKTYKDNEGIERTEFDQDNYLKELLKNIGDPNKAENFYQSMLMIGDTLIDTVNGMPSVLQDFYKYNSELGTLSGGIESVTEDTARRIEALENSQLGEVFAIRTMLQNYLEGSGFGDSMTADLQAAIASIASDTNLIRIATESILSRIDQMRNSNVQPLHVTIV